MYKFSIFGFQFLTFFVLIFLVYTIACRSCAHRLVRRLRLPGGQGALQALPAALTSASAWQLFPAARAGRLPIALHGSAYIPVFVAVSCCPVTLARLSIRLVGSLPFRSLPPPLTP